MAHYAKFAGTHGSCGRSRLRRAGTIRNHERTIGELFFEVFGRQRISNNLFYADEYLIAQAGGSRSYMGCRNTNREALCQRQRTLRLVKDN